MEEQNIADILFPAIIAKVADDYYAYSDFFEEIISKHEKTGEKTEANIEELCVGMGKMFYCQELLLFIGRIKTNNKNLTWEEMMEHSRQYKDYYEQYDAWLNDQNIK